MAGRGAGEPLSTDRIARHEPTSTADTVVGMHLGDHTEATFVAGSVARQSSLILWEPPETTGPERRGEAVVVGPDGPMTVAADQVPFRDAVRALAIRPASAPGGASVRAWTVATRLALHAIARGRMLPSITDDGVDEWRVGPLDAVDRDRIDRLVRALPAPAHATPGPDPGTVVAPAVAVARFLDAVADTFARTAAAPLAAGFDAFARTDAIDVSGADSWLRSTVAGTAGATAPGLRVELPTDDEGQVCCVLQVQSRLDASLVLDAAQLWQSPRAVQDRFGADVETELLLTLRAAARVWPPIERLLEAATPEVLLLEDGEVEDLFGSVADDLAAAGLPVLWPVEVFRPIEVSPIIAATEPEDGPPSAGPGLNLSALGEMRWHATVDGDDLTETELQQLAEAKRPMVRLRGRWVRADPARLRQLGERHTVGVGDVLAAALSGTVDIDGRTIRADVDGPLRSLADRLRDVDGVQALPAPDGLAATLRPYQERGLAWLDEMATLGVGGILADDMGLGKTIQLLALVLRRRRAALAAGDAPLPTLVVCPASVLGNWEREANRFVPELTVHRYHGTGRTLDGVGDGDLVLATYGIVRRDAEELAERRWDLVVADEAQSVKNPRSRTARALRTLPARARFALTGTPVENRLADLWALLDWTTPGLLGTNEGFQRTVATPIERDRDPDATAHLAALVRPFLLRRRKSDPEVAPDLPPKTETDRFVGLTVEQATLYKAVVAELLEDVSEAEGIGRKGLVLKLLTALKQICNHPAQYLDQDGPIPGRSAKLDAVRELLETIVDEGDSALVFTQYVAMGHLLLDHLAAAGIEAQFLHGGTPVPRRQDMVDRFQTGDPMVFVISLRAGGTGLNLTRATHVVHYDRWWNPAVEDQASDRAWRIGQDRPVQVHRMICEGTLEERIAALLESKRALAESVVGGGESWVSELSDDELAELVVLGQELEAS